MTNYHLFSHTLLYSFNLHHVVTAYNVGKDLENSCQAFGSKNSPLLNGGSLLYFDMN